MKKLLYPFVVLALMACGEKQQAPIDREALVDRNSPQVTAFDSLASLSVGNGEFAFTVDATGLQTFPEMYTKGVPLGTQSQWGWHEFTNPKGYRHEETLKDYDFGRGRMEPYSVQFNEDGRQKEAANWFRVNPHRLHLGMVGFEFGRDPLAVAQVTDIKQKLNLWEGVINSSFKLDGKPFEVQTACHPKADMVAATIRSEAHAGVNFRFPYPTGGHCDDACNWTSNDKHSTAIVSQDEQQVDATGLQTFPEMYTKGVPLGTQSQWGWHEFTNPKGYRHEETLKDYDFGRGRMEPYSVQFNEDGRQKEAANWFRVNPHRLHLGMVGFEFGRDPLAVAQVTDIKQKLNLWEGVINSSFKLDGKPFEVQTACHPKADMVAATIRSEAHAGVNFRFPYPTGGHCDDACNWTSNDKHSTAIVSQDEQQVVLKRTLDATTYYVTIRWEGKATFGEKEKNYFVLTPEEDILAFTCAFTPENSSPEMSTSEQTRQAAAQYWTAFWKNGAAVDFSACTDERAGELERRVVLSQYLLAIQCAGTTPPQETGLTYNSWFGKFHLEMIWWHQAQFALWNRADLLDRTLGWYETVEPVAREIAGRQGFDGIRWMKMTDPSGTEAPSKVGSFLIWQQPHFIYLAELVYRNNPSDEIIRKYNRLVQETADFMYSFATYDELEGRFVLKGAIPAQETLRASETVNPPFELSYWHFAMETAQKWRERAGEKRNLEWDEMIDKLSPLAYNEDKLYLAAETATDTYKDIRFTSDHMAVLGSVGILPMNKLIRDDYMKNTLHWIWDNWNWGKTWGWDYPMTAMNAARLGEPEKAVGALLMDKRTNTYLVNGHNYQDGRLRVYLPGNGGLLTAIAMMCAGWDGCQVENPGFPKDGTWNVRWEGLKPMP